MKNGKFIEGSKVLRIKIDMNSPNIHLRDPIMYRILNKKHHKTKDKWCIYPTYDWAHGQCDYIENISHSICSIEFENHKPLYNWYINEIHKFEKINNHIKPKQIEFSRLNLSYTLLSKRKLQYIINKNLIQNWDDPNMPTISGLKNKGYTPQSIINFCKKIGISKRKNIIDISLLEYSVKQHLNKISNRIMVVLNPIKIIIQNYPDNKFEWLDIENNPENINAGKRKIVFSKIIYIEQSDFMEKASNDFFRLSIGKKVKLKNAYVIQAINFVKKNNKINIIYCKYYPDSKLNIKKYINTFKSTLHWVSSINNFLIKVKIFHRLFSIYNPEEEKEYNFIKYFNNKHTEIISGYAEKYLQYAKIGDIYQFQRIGYFYLSQDRSSNSLMFNLISKLKN